MAAQSLRTRLVAIQGSLQSAQHIASQQHLERVETLLSDAAATLAAARLHVDAGLLELREVDQ
jgi:hypothetical protein